MPRLNLHRADHPLYSTWEGMRSRCNNPNHCAYPWYGARGIKICQRWDEFLHFLCDIGERPAEGYTLDRIEGSKGYAPGNVRWADKRTQSLNRRLDCRNISGRKGVTWFHRTKSWMTGVCTGGPKRIHLGYFDKLEDALVVHDEALLAFKNGVFESAYAAALQYRKINQPFRTNTSGVRGVSFAPRKGKWSAYVYVGNEKVHLGAAFETKEAAVIARENFMLEKVCA